MKKWPLQRDLQNPKAPQSEVLEPSASLLKPEIVKQEIVVARSAVPVKFVMPLLGDVANVPKDMSVIERPRDVHVSKLLKRVLQVSMSPKYNIYK